MCIRDRLYDKATNKQFITVQTKSGNTFFIVIDYDAPINEDEEQYQTYFLNMVDESDLLALLDDDTAAALTTCNCKEKCAAGQVNTDCPVCKTNMSECTGTAPVMPEPDKDAETDVPAPKPEKKSNVGMILIIFVLAGAAGAAYYYIKFVKGRKPKDEEMCIRDSLHTGKRKRCKPSGFRLDLSRQSGWASLDGQASTEGGSISLSLIHICSDCR